MTTLDRRAPRRALPLALAAILCTALAACGGGGGGAANFALPPVATPAPPPPAAPDLALASTAEGPVAGQRQDGLVAFLGIPYARPPVGDLRWAPPRPPAAHDATLQAQAFGTACLQAPETNVDGRSAEDCLYLNVWKPADAKPGDRLPVLVYIHGGAFVLGSGSQASGTLAARGGVVVVSFNYRLGALGYLANRSLRALNRDGSLGNFALMDQIAALEWVQRNIASFGGDAGKVTIWGTSAGATQSFSLLQSPKARGLFHRAVMQSGGGGEYSNQGMDTALGIGDAAVARLGCAGKADDAATVACLRGLPASALLAVGGSKWRPTVDAQVLTQVPARAFESGNFNQVPVMIGGVYDEGTLFVDTRLGADVYPFYLRGLAPAGFDTTAIEAAYPLSRFAVPAQGVARAIGDGMYACGNSARRGALSAWVPVYGWEFTDPVLSFPAKPSAFYYGSAHGMDSFYFGDMADQLAGYPYLDAADTTAAGGDAAVATQRRALAAQMSSYLLNFVRSGDPNQGTPVATPWPRFASPADPALIAFGYPAIGVTRGDFERTHRCDTLWGPGAFPPIY
ncbi:carboxylesterase/lipase family protein [Variovorax sp.]|jgi:para-nitrobenzyl esterase|uniref:carboxylesterase/lipase family protein n=2 Tax=Variovorax sp. TaxID=1871043 RepID=UPI00120E2CCD|nr:carboxylesterase family protein [Variovorax sp.]TAJ64113.1 MAG: carboxylesterase [Variovorax sp.]